MGRRGKTSHHPACDIKKYGSHVVCQNCYLVTFHNGMNAPGTALSKEEGHPVPHTIQIHAGYPGDCLVKVDMQALVGVWPNVELYGSTSMYGEIFSWLP